MYRQLDLGASRYKTKNKAMEKAEERVTPKKKKLRNKL